jgi:hypothetical protein
MGLRPISVGVSLEFYLHLIACHICIFDDMSDVLMKREKN